MLVWTITGKSSFNQMLDLNMRLFNNQIFKSLFPCALFDADCTDTPLRKRLRRKENRIILCKYIHIYLYRWFIIFSACLVTTLVTWVISPFTVVSWVLSFILVSVAVTLYIMYELYTLNPPALIPELRRQLSGHSLNE